MRLGFIGLGNMATAMISGMIQKGIASPREIIGSAKTRETLDRVSGNYRINAG